MALNRFDQYVNDVGKWNKELKTFRIEQVDQNNELWNRLTIYKYGWESQMK
jgi:hypothetical protein